MLLVILGCSWGASYNLGVLYDHMGQIPKARELDEEGRREGIADAAYTVGAQYDGTSGCYIFGRRPAAQFVTVSLV